MRDWHVYVVTDARLSRGRSHAEVVRAALEGGADVVQLRDKEASGRTLYEAALELRAITRAAGVPLIVNDRIDVAVAADAEGAHVGQDDLPAKQARRVLGNGRLLGVSAVTLDDALRAEADGADYLGVGPIFDARRTKPDADPPLGEAGLAQIRAGTSKPVVAIGGLDADNAENVIVAGADALAVVSAVVGADDVAEAVRDLRDRVLRAKRSVDARPETG
jgi:thiamine-phosphate pyrophosphorylase